MTVKNCKVWSENPCVHFTDGIGCEHCDIHHFACKVAQVELEKAALELAECVNGMSEFDEIHLLSGNVLTAEGVFGVRLRRLMRAAKAKQKVEGLT